MKYILLFLTLSLQAQHPFLPALAPELKLKSEISGNILLGELNCSSCHESSNEDIFNKQAPILDKVPSRIKRSYIVDYLLAPQKVKKGTTMPDVLHKLPIDKKKKVATAIAAYLVKDEVRSGKNEGDVLIGKELFHSIGCVACHSPRDAKGHETITDSVPLGDLSAKYLARGLTQFLFEPHKVRPSGRMPDMKLTQKEAQSLSAYLLSSKTKSVLLPKITPELIKEGKRYFTEFNCAACHQRQGHTPRQAQKMASLKKADCNGPAYSLSVDQKKLITNSLLKPSSLNDADKITQKMATFNCFACHQRNGQGGISELRDQYFTSEEHELGVTGRVPPPLTNIGAKLQKKWLQKVMLNGESERHYMHTRMPQFGETQMNPLVDLLDKTDKVEKSGLTDVAQQDQKAFRTAGWQLIGTQGNNCVSCHNYNGHASLGLKALDIFNTAERLKRDWFYHYMLNPTAHRPGTVMPSFWPGGKSLRQDILGGDTKDQLRAMWYYFTRGQSQRTPYGLVIKPVILSATKAVKVYRGRSKNSGFRGIAIGFPEGLNLTFDAKHMSFTSLWQGKFVQVNWRGQASGNYNPAESVLPFNSGIPFAKLKAGEKWPKWTKPEGRKNRENTDPLFAQRHGYQFKGYYFDKKKNPVFMYLYKHITIEDALSTVDKQTLSRTLYFDSKRIDSFSFRLASTQLIKKINDQKVRVNDSFEIEISKPYKFIQQDQDWLIELKIPAGKSQLQLKYRVTK